MATTKIRGNTQIIDKTITNDQINDSAAISTSKLADGASFLKSDGSVSLTSSLNLNSQKIINVTDPTSAQDAATKNYVDSAVQGLDIKASVKVATTGNITLSSTQTIDGIELEVGDRILVKNQDAKAENGLFNVQSSAWTRADDANTSDKVTSGMFVFVEQGTVNADTGWVLTTDSAVSLGTTELNFSQFSGAGTVVAGAGLTKTGSQIDFVAGDTSLTVGDDSVAVNLNSGGTLSVSSGLKVSDAGITETQIASSSLSSSGGLSGGSGTKLSVKLNGTTLSLTTDGLKLNTSKFIKRETPTGALDGSNTDFTLDNTPITGSEEVFLNGLLQDDNYNDYGISGGTITFVVAPQVGDKIRVNYIISD